MFLVLARLGVALASDAVIILHPSAQSLISGLVALDNACQSAVGINFQALVCSANRTWSSLLSSGAPLYTDNNVRVGSFPSLSSPITELGGAAPSGTIDVFTGCTTAGDLGANCVEFKNPAATMEVGSTGGLGSWLGGSQSSCAAAGRIYCVARDQPPAIWVARNPIAQPLTGIEPLNTMCRNEDNGLLRTYALVCQSSINWPTVLQGQSLVGHKFDNVFLGPQAFNVTYQLTAPLKYANGSAAAIGPILTGCSISFAYASSGTTCGDWTQTAGGLGYMGTGGDSQSWFNNGYSAAACGTTAPIFCVRLTTAFPTPAPTSAPTTAAPTGAPTTSAPTATPTTTAPTSMPTLAPSQAPTQAPSQAPTTQTPTQAPSRAPTSQAPSRAPTNGGTTPTMPTWAPTPRPTAVTTITNFTGNVTQNVTVPGNGADVTVILPSLLFLYGNSTASVAIGKGSLSDLVDTNLLGGDSVVSVDVLVDGDPVDVMGLSIPIEFVIPRPSAVCAAQLNAPAKCVWWDTEELKWRTDNCTTTPITMDDGSPATRCSCNHLTDFAVLLDRAARCIESPNQSYPVFAAIYGTITMYCMFVIARLEMLHDRTTRFLQAQHATIGAVGIVRMLSCLHFYGLLGDELIFEGFLTAFPYLIELWIFTRLASTWLGLVEFTMLATELRWEKLRPWLYGINIVGSLFVIGLFAAFFVELDFTTALVGTIGIATVYMILAITFLYYSGRLVTSMSPGKGAMKKHSDGLCGATTKILLAGRVSAICFCVQAVSSVLALVLQRDVITQFTITFLAFNCLALIGLLMIYQGAVARGVREKSAASAVSSMGSRSGMKHSASASKNSRNSRPERFGE